MSKEEERLVGEHVRCVRGGLLCRIMQRRWAGEGEDKVRMANRIGYKDVGSEGGAAGVDMALVGRGSRESRSGRSIRRRGRGGILNLVGISWYYW